MVMAVILAGGSGSRLGGDIPKQYLMAGKLPVIGYGLHTFQKHEKIDAILIVCEEMWQPFVRMWVRKLQITKFCGFADAGKSRQHSIYNALRAAKSQRMKEKDVIMLHDAARPCVKPAMLSQCIAAMDGVDGVMPALTVKDTVYVSRDGMHIDSLLCRDELFAGQAPECFRFGPYFQIHEILDDEALGRIRGSSEIAYRSGLNIRIIPGDEGNIKITTIEDLEKFRLQAEKYAGREAFDSSEGLQKEGQYIK